MTPTILQTRKSRRVTLTLNRPERKNALNRQMMLELLEILSRLELDEECSIIVMEGSGGYFCAGMDFDEFASQAAPMEAQAGVDSTYMAILKAIASSGKAVIAMVDGQVLAGGIGLVAASDLAIATSRSSFGLPEALWGLLPACVTPYLIRRVGFQKAYKMTLTTQTVTAPEALAAGLVDDMSDAPEEVVRRYMLRLNRLDATTVKTLKAYFRKMWIVDDGREQIAVEEINRLAREPRVMENIRNYVVHQKFPWES